MLADHLGSTRAILDAADNVVAQLEYGPYGKSRAAGTAATRVRYRYTGHPWNESQGVNQTPARGYDPTQGRFLSVDPQRQGASPYVYAGNNPVGFLDPTGGVKVPFFMRSGFWGVGDEFASVGLTNTYVKSRLQFIKDISATLGWDGGQYIQDATRTFGSNPLNKPGVIDHTLDFLRGQVGSNRAFQYDDRLYWLVGDEKDIVLPSHFHEGVQRIRAVSRENWGLAEFASPNFAKNIVLVDFTQPGSDAIRRVSEFLSGGEYKVWGVAASEILQPPPDDPQIPVQDNLQMLDPNEIDEILGQSFLGQSQYIQPEIQEILDEMFPVGQQGPDARGGAGPAPPPTSIDAFTGQSIGQTMQEQTRFRSTSMQPTVITTLDSYDGD